MRTPTSRHHSRTSSSLSLPFTWPCRFRRAADALSLGRAIRPKTFKYRGQLVTPSPSSLQRDFVALSMKLSEYQDLYGKLATAEDIDFLAENFGYDKELLLVIYTQRIVRDTTKKFYRVKAQARRLAFMWQNGTSLVEIAHRFEFPAILTSLMVLEQRKVSRKQFWKMINDLESVRDRRLRKELEEVARADIVYSPEGSARQYARGRWGEAKLQTWLDSRDLQYETEKELRAKYDKTPDIVRPTFFETPPIPYPYVPVSETRLEDAGLESDAAGLPE